MSTIRVEHKTRDFCTISNVPVFDSSLSFEARGVLVYALARPKDWVLRDADLEKQGGLGEHKLARIKMELKAAGYLSRERVRQPDGTFIWETTVYEIPELNPNFRTTPRKPRHILNTKQQITEEQITEKEAAAASVSAIWETTVYEIPELNPNFRTTPRKPRHGNATPRLSRTGSSRTGKPRHILNTKQQITEEQITEKEAATASVSAFSSKWGNPDARENSELLRLEGVYSAEWVEKAIQETKKRSGVRKPLAIIALILDDWKRGGYPYEILTVEQAVERSRQRRAQKHQLSISERGETL
jgi:hypothetical protein